MHVIFPEPAEIDPDELVSAADRTHPRGRPWLLCNMIESLDGATTIGSKSGGLGGKADKALFRALRGIADVILVAGGTARAENYGPITVSEPVRKMRVDRGQDPLPRLAIVTGSLRLDLDSPLFTQSDPAPVVITSAGADAARRTEVATKADLLLAGHGEQVDLTEALRALGEMGASTVLCEGGPSLNGQLLAEGLLDELCLSLSPLLVGGDSKRIFHGALTAGPQPMQVQWVIEEESYLFMRYIRAV